MKSILWYSLETQRHFLQNKAIPMIYLSGSVHTSNNKHIFSGWVPHSSEIGEPSPCLVVMAENQRKLQSVKSSPKMLCLNPSPAEPGYTLP